MDWIEPSAFLLYGVYQGLFIVQTNPILVKETTPHVVTKCLYE